MMHAYISKFSGVTLVQMKILIRVHSTLPEIPSLWWIHCVTASSPRSSQSTPFADFVHLFWKQSTWLRRWIPTPLAGLRQTCRAGSLLEYLNSFDQGGTLTRAQHSLTSLKIIFVYYVTDLRQTCERLFARKDLLHSETGCDSSLEHHSIFGTVSKNNP